MTKSEWKKLRPGEWAHVSGWHVYHCGHPTANWPYYATGPGAGSSPGQSKMLLFGGMGLGYAFPRLVPCQDAVEKIVNAKLKGTS